MVSGLPIGWNTSVRFLGLMEAPSHHDYLVVYPDGLWSPIHPGIKARYNDYGSIENVEPGILADTFFGDLSDRAIERDRKDEYHDVDVKKGMPQEQWLKALYYGKVSFKNFRGQIASVRQAMIREDVWQILLEMTPFENNFEDWYLDIHGYGPRRRSADFKETTERTIEYFQKNHPDAAYIEGMRKSLLPSPLQEFQKDLFRVQCSLRALSRIWIPGHMVGPQFPEWDVQAKYTQAINDLAQEQLRRQREEEG